MPRITDGRKGIIDMTRDEKTSILCMVTDINFYYLQSLSKEDLDKLYRERVEKKNEQVQR
jgi:hypothetical protein